MANRNFNRKQALEREVKEIYAEIAIGSTGAPTLTRGTGVASIERNSAGSYTLTLQDKYMRLMHAAFTLVAPSTENLDIQIQSSDVSSAKTVTFVCHVAGSDTDPQDGDSILVKLDLKNSTAV